MLVLLTRAACRAPTPLPAVRTPLRALALQIAPSPALVAPRSGGLALSLRPRRAGLVLDAPLLRAHRGSHHRWQHWRAAHSASTTGAAPSSWGGSSWLLLALGTLGLAAAALTVASVAGDLEHHSRFSQENLFKVGGRRVDSLLSISMCIFYYYL